MPRNSNWRRLPLLIASLSVVVIASLSVVVRSPAAREQSSASVFAGQPSSEARIIAQQREQWARELRDKRIEALVAAYVQDGEFLQPDGSRIRGTAQIRKLYETITNIFDSDLIFESQRVEGSGNLIYDSGTYHESLIVRATRKPQLSTGSYLTIYRRNPSGAWLIVEQMWTGSMQ
jgi:ketosteroid isomerase-like protein